MVNYTHTQTCTKKCGPTIKQRHITYMISAHISSGLPLDTSGIAPQATKGAPRIPCYDSPQLAGSHSDIFILISLSHFPQRDNPNSCLIFAMCILEQILPPSTSKTKLALHLTNRPFCTVVASWLPPSSWAFSGPTHIRAWGRMDPPTQVCNRKQWCL